MKKLHIMSIGKGKTLEISFLRVMWNCVEVSRPRKKYLGVIGDLAVSTWGPHINHITPKATAEPHRLHLWLDLNWNMP